jgi:hypothetical protein
VAKIVLGLGCSHTPQLHTPAEQWDIRATRDAADALPLWLHGERLRYSEVLEQRSHLDLGSQTTMQIREQRLQKAHEALGQLADVYSACSPDVAIVFGNDQGEIFVDEPRHAFTIMGAAEFQNLPRTMDQIDRLPPGIALSDSGHLPDAPVTLPGHPPLAAHIAASVSASGCEVNFLSEQVRPDPDRAQTSGMPHAYGFIYKQVMRSMLTPQVPVDTNTLFPPNQPTIRECLEFGKQVGQAITSWPEDIRVCVIASGGLSHFVVDEEFDRDILAAMTRNDFEHLCGYSEGYYQAGSSEIKSWLAAGGAMSGAGLEGRVVGYQALYRTAAGTGSSAAFVVWE